MIACKKFILLSFVLFFTIFSLLFFTYPILPFLAFAEGIQGRETLWEIDDGIPLYSDPDVFDHGPTAEYWEFTIPDQLSEEITGFPGGLAGISARANERRCFPVKILLQFSLKQNYARSNLKIGMKGKGTFVIQLDSLPTHGITMPPHELTIDTGFGWDPNNAIPWPYIATGDYTISLEAGNDNAYAYFDYLRFTGYPDTDSDGICDQDEGDLDRDGDDVVDWQDSDCTMIPVPYKPLEKLLLMVRPQDTFGGSPSPVLKDVSISDIRSMIHDPNDFSDMGASGIEFIYGLIFCRICDIGAVGGAVLILSPPELYGMEQVLLKDTEGKNWIDPDANIDKINNELQFLITDGGPYDIDQTDDRISFYFGIGIPEKLSPYSTTTCFIRSLTDNE